MEEPEIEYELVVLQDVSYGYFNTSLLTHYLYNVDGLFCSIGIFDGIYILKYI